MIPHIPKSLITYIDNESCKCVKRHPHLHDHPSLCEAVAWSPYNDKNSYTIHAHTIAGVDYPSQADVRTTNHLGKKNLCIVNTVDRTLTCYSGKNFQKKSQRKI